MKKIQDESFVLRGIKFLGSFVFFLAIFVVITFFNLFPYYPKTLKGWLVLLIFGIPLYLAGEAFFKSVFFRKMGEKISKKTFSLARILVALIIVLISYGILFLVYVLFLRKII